MPPPRRERPQDVPRRARSPARLRPTGGAVARDREPGEDLRLGPVTVRCAQGPHLPDPRGRVRRRGRGVRFRHVDPDASAGPQNPYVQAVAVVSDMETMFSVRPLSLLATVALILAIAYLAGILPAGRVARKDPIDALRYE